jgi:hypothetical protein
MMDKIEEAYSEENFLDIDANRLRGSDLDRWTVLRLNGVAKECTSAGDLFQRKTSARISPAVMAVATDPNVIGSIFVAGGGAALAGYFGIVAPLKRRRMKEMHTCREREDQQRREATAAEPLTVLVLPDLTVFAQVDPLMADFETLRTFTDVARWGAMASHVADILEEAHRDLLARADDARALLVTYEATNGDPRHVAAARIAKTENQLTASAAVVNRLTLVYESVSERVDMTPTDAEERQLLLRDLRVEKERLLASKKAALAAKANKRGNARSQPSGDYPSPWSMRQRVVDERRAIRQAREEDPRPQEDAVACLERQILATERRTAWAQRISQSPAATAPRKVTRGAPGS